TNSRDTGTCRELADLRALLLKCAGILSLSLVKPDVSGDVTDEIERLVRERDSARERKDFKKADEIRKKISDLGFAVEDTSGGSVWRKK
ncbi:MAG TPA: hypothetical protein PKZ41_05010, partial [Candidatus Omnitrophota bacterium]|nr:hypothetical protein [Candidatus Omnitrophota bacterium]